MTNSKFRFGVQFLQHIKSFGLIAAIQIDILQFFKTVRYKHDYILSYLEKRYSSIINQYKYETDFKETIPDDSIIWVCWLQGQDHMPESVMICYNSIKRHSGKRKVQLVTWDNYQKFASIPKYVVNKVEKGQISFTHFSDILRCNLLADHGGVWIDAALLLTDRLQIPPVPFYSIKLRQLENDFSFVSNYKWVVGFMGGTKGNVLHSFMKDFFNAYCKDETMFIDYFLADYIIALAYKNMSSVKKMIDAVPYSNEDFYYIETNLFQPVKEQELKQVLQRSRIFKLGYKGFPQHISCDSLYHYLFKR